MILEYLSYIKARRSEPDPMPSHLHSRVAYHHLHRTERMRGNNSYYNLIARLVSIHFSCHHYHSGREPLFTSHLKNPE